MNTENSSISVLKTLFLFYRNYVTCAVLKLSVLQALIILTEMLRDQRGAKLRSFVLPAIGEMLCLISNQVCLL